MFKKGNRIIPKKESPAYGAYLDRILIVKHDQGDCAYCDDYRGVCYYIDNLSSDGWMAKYFILHKLNPTNEVEFLNAFQHNFKDGI